MHERKRTDRNYQGARIKIIHTIDTETEFPVFSLYKPGFRSQQLFVPAKPHTRHPW